MWPFQKKHQRFTFTLEKQLIATAFCSGMTIMAIEMTASRLMAPYFGNSVFIWTNLIGIIMLALSVGYWYGGKWADRNPTTDFLYTLILVCSLFLFTLPLIGPWIMDLGSSRVSSGEWSIVIYSFMTSLILFGMPFVFLGMISPTIIRLLTHKVKESGEIAGQVFAASTVGSIVGTFLPTLLLVPTIGTKRTMFLFAFVLLLVALAGLKKKWVGWLTTILLVVAALTPSEMVQGDDIVYQTESYYTHLRVRLDDGKYLLEQDEGLGVHSEYDPAEPYTGEVWDFILLQPFFQQEKREQTVSIVGVAGGTSFRILDAVLGNRFNFQFTGAEIDPKTEEIAREYFGLGDYENLDMYNMDGRLYVRGLEDDSVDVMMVDAYQHLYMPPHMTSVEFFELTKDKIKPGGSMMVNLNATLDSTVYNRILRTIGEVYPHIWVLPMDDEALNKLIFASETFIDMDYSIAGLADFNPTIADEIQENIFYISELPDVRLSTDDSPLMEVLIDQMVAEFLFF